MSIEIPAWVIFLLVGILLFTWPQICNWVGKKIHVR